MKKNVISIALGLITSVLFGMVLLMLQGYNPLEVYGSILNYGLFSGFGATNTLNRTSILLLTGASAAIALGSGVSNLGQFGQLLFGAITAVVVGLNLTFLPQVILIPTMIIAGGLAGALYASIAILFKLKFNMNEFISTLMLNFIANLFTSYLVAYPLLDPKSSWPMSRVVPKIAVFKSIGNLDPNFIVSVIIMIALIIYKYRTVDGFESKIMGSNIIFAKYGGVKTTKQFKKIMLISGMLAGIAGALMIIGSSQQNRFLPSLGESFGSDGLMVSIVSNSNLILVCLYSFIFSIIQSGSTGMQLDTGVPSEFTVMLIAITVLCVVAFRSYSTIFMNKLEMKRNEEKIKEENTDGTSN